MPIIFVGRRCLLSCMHCGQLFQIRVSHGVITIINKIGAHVSIFPFNGINIVDWVAQTLIIFWGSVLVAIGLRRFFPRFARIAFGGR